MKLYHFSDKYLNPDDFMPVGNFKVTISNSSNIVQQFEEYMEERRITTGIANISRLNCLFTFPKHVAEGFKTQRKFLYELEVTDDIQKSSHNHEIGTYFQNLFKFNDIDFIKNETNLIDSYWSNQQPFIDSNGVHIKYEEEILVDKPLKILRTISWNEISKEEFLRFGLPFYHITPTRNIESILENGLENRNGRGICVVQKNHILVIKYIVDMMLIGDGDTDFSIIKILPNEHGIESKEIAFDGVQEATNCIHNYIRRGRLRIRKEHVIGSYQADPRGIPDLKSFENILNSKGLLMPLIKNNG
ncbi:MAG: hypothetical protein ACK40G_02160 [Cytophagaceae bacterium]